MEFTVDQTLQNGVAAHKSGKFQEAERLYRAILQEQPNHPHANHNLGVLAMAVGKPREAIPFFEVALECSPNTEQFWLSYTDALIKLERFADARRVLVEAEKYSLSPEKLGFLNQKIQTALSDYKNKTKQDLTVLEKRKKLAEKKKSKKGKGPTTSSGVAPSQDQINVLLGSYQAGGFVNAEALAGSLTQHFPQHPFAWKVLGAVFKQTGRFNESLLPMQKSVELSPGDAEAHSNLGVTLKELGRLEKAEASYRQAIALKPDFAEAHSNLGVTLKELGRLVEAEASCRQAISLKPDYAEAHSNLGNTLIDVGRLDEAEASCRRAIALRPEYAEAHSNLGVTLRAQRRLDEAEASHKKAISLKPHYAEPYSNLGLALKELGRLDEAVASYKQAISLKPDHAEAHSNLGVVLQELGRLDEAEASYRQAIALEPEYTVAHSNLLMLIGSMLFNEVRYRESAADFATAVYETITCRFETWSHSRDEKSLRVGFVSGDLRSHPVGYFLESLLSELQSSSIELFAYPTINEMDEVTLRLQPVFDVWSPLTGLSDMEAAKKIHGNGIHILIDLSGHTANNRLPVFAWKPAPIQVSWLGYFASTGLPEMDYVLGDPYVTPYEEAHHFVEEIWQLPESYLCFTSPNDHVEVAPLPALTNGFITFGCFNNLARMTDEVVSIRAALMHAVPESKLFLKDKQLDHEAGRSRVLSRFAALGIGADRLILEGRSPRIEYLSCYSRVDIALSPFPYGGGTTSVEGIWMGVPVVSKKGSHFLSLLGESIAHNSGLSDWIASDEEEYVAKAVAYASNVEALSDLRTGMRDRILDTPLFNIPRFAEYFEQAIRAMRDRIG